MDATSAAVFNLTNKQSFFNEWDLTAGLALASLAFGPVLTTVARPPALQEAVVRS